MCANDSPGGLTQPPGANALVSATRSVSGLRAHMPVNSTTWFWPSLPMTRPGYRRPQSPAVVRGRGCSVEER